MLFLSFSNRCRYSGAAWATVAEFEDGRINLITSWPGTEREEGKAPTELFYEDGRLMWGYTIPLDADPIRCFKLLLHEDDLPPGIRESEILLRARKRIRECQKTAIDLIADYLGALWRHILDTINRARQPVIEALKFHVVITVPAIWKDYARQSMEKAAEKSGILAPRRAGPTTLALASEPEAAALASLDDKRPSINVGDVFVICDAGGGTVVSWHWQSFLYIDSSQNIILGHVRILSVTKSAKLLRLNCMKLSSAQVCSLPY